MTALQDFVAVAIGSTAARFTQEFPHPFLLLRLRQEEGRSDDWNFNTRTFTNFKPTLPKLGQDAAAYQAFALVKAVHNPWPDRISIGRARNNDVVLADSSVSKLHLHLVRSPDGSFAVQDSGSRNGTQVAGVRARPGEIIPLKFGDLLTIGALHLTYIASGELHSLLLEKLEKT